MALKWANLAGTVLGYIRLGLSGVRLKNSSGSLSIRNAGDSADAVVLPQSLGTGTRDGTKFLRDDGTWQATDILQNSQSSAYTAVLSDSGGHIFHPSADTTARIWTIPANASVAYPIGTALTFINQNAAGVITIAITTDTMRLAGAGTTGSRTLAANGLATAVKITSTEWLISGVGLT